MIIVSDDQPWNSLHVMPNTEALLARRGVTFTNMFVSNSMCCPSRSTILTGRYSDSTGVWRNFPPHGGFDAFDDRSTVATWLAPTYRTALVGKYLNGYGAHMSLRASRLESLVRSRIRGLLQLLDLGRRPRRRTSGTLPLTTRPPC